MSRFVLLTDTILLEYIYYNKDEITTIGNEWLKNDDFYKLVNNNDKSISIYNADNSKLTTHNVRDFSYAASDTKLGKFGLLDIDRLVFYNDFDSNLTNTTNLPITFAGGPYNTVYDKVRIHLSQNFDFEGYDGFVFDVSVSRADNQLVNLLKLAYNKFDDYRILNSNGFVFLGRFFSSYLEFYIPSYNYLKEQYYLNPLTGDTPTEKLSDSKGWKRDGVLNFSFGWVENREAITPNDYIYVYRRKAATLPDRDPFEVIGTQVVESSNGDYIELYPTYNNNNISQFITDLNSVGNDYILIHDIVVSEYIGNGLNTNLTGGSWVITTNLSISQTSGFENPINYRPIIENDAAIAFRIDYIVRLYDRNKNTQVWRTGSLISYNARKYLKKLLRIDLGSNRPQQTIYNQLVNTSINFENPITTDVEPTIRYVTTFTNTNNIAASFSIDEPDTTTTTDDLLTTIFSGNLKSTNKSLSNVSKSFGNGELKILVADSGNFCRFVFKDLAPNGGYQLKDLSMYNDLRLRFYREDSTFVELLDLKNTTDDKSRGEVTFQVSTADAKRIKGFKGRSFNVVSIGQDNTESVLYTGEFLLQDEYIKDLKNNRITSLTNENTALKTDIKAKDANIQTLTEEVERLKTLEISLKTTIDTLNKTLTEAKAKLGENKVFTDDIAKSIKQAQSKVVTNSITTDSKLQIESDTKNKLNPKTGKATFLKP